MYSNSLICGKKFVERQRQELERAAEDTQSKAYASGTLENLKIQWALYQNLCDYFNFCSLPATQNTLVIYIQFLAQKMCALSTVKNYIASIKTLHNLLEFNTEAFNSIRVKLMWMGLNNAWETIVKRAAPIDPQVLRDIKQELNLNCDKDLVFWLVCLTAFFILARKSNLIPVKDFDPKKQLAAKHIQFKKNKVQIMLHWSKTCRLHQDPVRYSLHYIQGSQICPFDTLKIAL